MGEVRVSGLRAGRSRRGSYFYVIDAFIAAIIIVAGLLVVTSQFSSQSSSTQAIYTADDFLATMDTTEVGSYDHATVRAWMISGYIDDPKRSLLQQLALFELTGNLGNASGNLSAALAASTPQTVGIEVIVNGRQRFYRPSVSQTQSDTMLTAKRIVLLRRSPSETYDPAIIEVRTWQ